MENATIIKRPLLGGVEWGGVDAPTIATIQLKGKSQRTSTAGGFGHPSDSYPDSILPSFVKVERPRYPTKQGDFTTAGFTRVLDHALRKEVQEVELKKASPH